MWDFDLLPEQASTIAPRIDALTAVLSALSGIIIIVVVGAIVYFTVKYRHTADADRSNPVVSNTKLEMTGIVGLMIPAIAVFVWAASVYVDVQSPPSGDPLEIYTVGKQWMWKFQHPNGAREINTLHVPVGQPVQLTMTSQDVIHSLFLPAFRVKHDVLPGRYTSVWFEATQTGTFHLFCTEYCGTSHSNMTGYVRVMRPSEYEEWLELGATGGSRTEPGTGRFGRTPTGPPTPPVLPQADAETTAERAARGRALFVQLQCNVCHRIDSTALQPGVGPVLEDVYGRLQRLQNERRVVADEAYLRESILYPQNKIVQGYPPVMPPYQGQISEDQVMQLVAYLRTLNGEREAAEQPPTPQPEAEGPTGIAAAGRELFVQLQCDACHRVDSTAAQPTVGPVLEGLYSHTVTLQNGEQVVADPAYLRESILSPQNRIVQGYPPVMPSYQGQISEDQLMQLIAYLRSLSEEAGEGE